jgi:hypothetical protein
LCLLFYSYLQTDLEVVHVVAVVRTIEHVPEAIHAHQNEPAEVQDVQEHQSAVTHVLYRSRHVVMFHEADQDPCETIDRIVRNRIVVAVKEDAIHALAQDLVTLAMAKIKNSTYKILCIDVRFPPTIIKNKRRKFSFSV